MKTIRSGFTLVEAMVCFLLLAVVGGSAVVLLTGLFADNRGLDERHSAAIAFESLGEVFRERAKSDWPNSVSVSGGDIDGYVYDVDDRGLVVSNPVGPGLLDIKELHLTLRYQVTNDAGEREQRELTCTMMVAR